MCLFAIAMQMFQPLKEELLNLERGVVMHDASIDKDALVVAPVLLVKSDNPRASELLGHKGSIACKQILQDMFGRYDICAPTTSVGFYMLTDQHR